MPCGKFWRIFRADNLRGAAVRRTQGQESLDELSVQTLSFSAGGHKNMTAEPTYRWMTVEVVGDVTVVRITVPDCLALCSNSLFEMGCQPFWLHSVCSNWG